MTGDEQLVSVVFPQHVHAHDSLGDYYGMDSVESNRLDRMQTLKRAAILTRKRHIPAKLAHRAARLQATNHVPLCQMLMLDGDRRVGKDSFVLQHTQRTSRQQESGCPRKVPIWHSVLSLAFLRWLA
jgi:hypothetical protein